MVGEAYPNIQIVSCATAQITLNNGISAYRKLRNILSFYEVGRNMGV